MATRVCYDPDAPGIPQVYRMGKSYGPWSYAPLPNFGDNDSIVIVGGPLERLTHVSKWVPLVWLAVACSFLVYSLVQSEAMLVYWFVGLFGAWPLVEYSLHRWLFHLSTESGIGVLNVIHFLLHGIHHKTPKDSTRLLAPLPMILALATPLYLASRLFLALDTSMALWSGILMGYVQYDYTHLYLHTPGKKPWWIRGLVKKHLAHHQKDHDKYYAISYLTDALVSYFPQ